MYSLLHAILAALLLGAAMGKTVRPPKSRFTYYEMPTEFSGPCDLVGHNGKIFIQDILAAKIAVIDPDSGNVTDYAIPYTSKPLHFGTIPSIAGRTPLACAIQPGSDGLMYAASGIRNQLVQFHPHTMKMKIFSPPNHFLGNLQPFNDLYRSKDGMYFTQTTANVVSFFDYKKQAFTKEWKIPTPLSLPLGCYVTQDGAVWFTEFGLDKIGRLNATTGKFKEFPVGLGLGQPAVIRAETGGKIFFTAATGNAIGSVDIQSYKIERFAASLPLRVPGTDILDGKDNVWFSSFSSNVLGKLNPRTGETTAVRTYGLSGGKGMNIPILAISVTYGKPNSIYFTETTSNQVGRLQLIH